MITDDSERLEVFSNGDFELRSHFVAFIDLLGFGKSLIDADTLAAKVRLSHPLPDGLLKPFRDLYRFRQTFVGIWGGIEDGNRQPPPGPIAGTPAEQAEKIALWKRGIPPLATTQFLSDAVILAVPLDSNQPTSIYMALRHLAAGTGLAAFLLLTEGIAVRGGLSVGYGIEVADGDLVSAGVARAYGIESKIANDPRVVVDNKLLAGFAPERDSNFPWRPKEQELASHLWKLFHDQLRIDIDQHHFVDFLGRQVVGIAEGHGPEGRAMLAKAATAVQTNLYAVGDGTMSGRKAEKWMWLGRYWNRSYAAERTGVQMEIPE